MSGPENNQNLPLATREAFGKVAQKTKDHLAAIGKATGTGAADWKLECDYEAVFKLLDGAKKADQFAHLLVNSYLMNLTEALQKWCADAFNKETLLRGITAKAIMFVLLPAHDPEYLKTLNAKVNRLKIGAGGRLIIESEVKSWSVNVSGDLTTGALDTLFDTVVDEQPPAIDAKVTPAPTDEKAAPADPITHKNVMLTVRRQFRDNAQKKDAALTDIAKALGVGGTDAKAAPGSAGSARFGFEIDYLGAYKHLAQNNRHLKFGYELWGCYLPEVAKAFQSFAKDAYCAADFKKYCPANTLVWRLKCPEPAQGAFAVTPKDHRFSFENGRFVIETDIKSWQKNTSDINNANFEEAINVMCDKETKVVSDANDTKTWVDPKTCPYFALTTRKSFRDAEKKRDELLAATSTALGYDAKTGGLVLEANYASCYDQMRAANKHKTFGHELWFAYVSALKNNVCDLWGKDAFNREDFRKYVSTKTITFRMADPPADYWKLKDAKCNRLSVESGKFVIETDTKSFGSNASREVGGGAIEDAINLLAATIEEKKLNPADPIDPVTCPALPLTARKFYRDNAKAYADSVAAIKASCGVDFKFDIPHWKAYKLINFERSYNKLGYNLHKVYCGYFATLFAEFIKTDAQKRKDALKAKIGGATGVIAFDISEDPALEAANTTHTLSVETGKIVLKFHWKNFMQNTGTISAGALVKAL